MARVLACCVVGAGLGLLLTGLAAADVLPWSGRVALSAPAHAAWFASGMAVAALVAADDTGVLPGRRGATWQLVRTSPDLMAGTAAVLLLVAVTPLAGPRGFAEIPAGHAVAKELVYALVATAALLACISRDASDSATGRILGGRVMRYLGRISYGIFLWHLLVMNWWYEVDPRPLFSGGFWVVLVATTTGSILVSSLRWFRVERRSIAAASSFSSSKDESPAQGGHGPEGQDLGDVRTHGRLVGPSGSDDHQATDQQEPRTDHR